MRHASWWIACAVAALATRASADGLDAERLAPATGVEGGFALEPAAVPPHLAWALGLFLDVADDPVVVDDGTGMTLARPLDTAASADLLGAIGLFGRAELGVHLPVQVVYNGDDVAAAGSMLSANAGLGDLRLVPKVNLLRLGDEVQHGLLSFAAAVTLPTGDAEALRGAGGVTLEPRLLYAHYLGRLGLQANLGYRWRSQHPAGLPWGDEITFGAGALYAITPAFTGRIEGFGGKQVGADTDGADLPLELLGGVDYWFGSLGLYAGAALGVTDGIGDPDFRVVVGVRYRHRAAPHQGFSDSDGDGIVDQDDRCRDSPEDEDGFEDTDGCPEADNDNDGVLDQDDECPEIAEEPGGDRDGCPARTYVKIVESEIVVFGKVRFTTGSSEIDPRSEPLLDQLGQALSANPQVKKVRIEGHTDNVGGKDINQDLSEERAKAVKAALEKRGIDGDRLVPAGYGESRPTAPNATPAGRAKNRRVEFIIQESQ